MNIAGQKFVKDKIPVCIHQTFCNCFEKLCGPINFLPGSTIEDFIYSNLKWVDTFFSLLDQHINKDLLNKTEIFKFSRAHTIKRALDHLYNTLTIFENFFIQSGIQTFNVHESPNVSLAGKDVIQAFKGASLANSNLLQIFQTPNNLLKTNLLINVLEIHLFILCVFEQFNNLFKHGQNFYGQLEIKNYYRITISFN